jgi:hypothetical protein
MPYIIKKYTPDPLDPSKMYRVCKDNESSSKKTKKRSIKNKHLPTAKQLYTSLSKCEKQRKKYRSKKCKKLIRSVKGIDYQKLYRDSHPPRKSKKSKKTTQCFSKGKLTLEKAKKQKIAIILSEHRRSKHTGNA